MAFQGFEDVVIEMVFLSVDDQIIVHRDFAFHDVGFVCDFGNCIVNKH